MMLREIRLSKKLTIPQLAALSGVHRRTIEELEKHDRCMVSTALKLSKALGVDMNTFCKGAE